MLFLGIDQQARQLTVSLRDQQGDVLLARQVSTRSGKILQFFDQITQCCAEHNESFIAVVEVCGFNDWLIPHYSVIIRVIPDEVSFWLQIPLKVLT